MRVMWLGTYERDYPRARVLIEGLREIGVDVVERHRPVWERERHKAGAFLRPLPLARALRALRRRVGRAGRRGRCASPAVDAIVAGYPAQPDALPAWCVARARRVPLVVDMMISLADTLAGDRGRAGRLDRRRARRRRPRHAPRWPTWSWPTPPPAPTGWPSASACPARAVAVVPVGAEPDRFPAAPAAGRRRRPRSSTASSRRCTGSRRCSRRRGGPGSRRCA